MNFSFYYFLYVWLLFTNVGYNKDGGVNKFCWFAGILYADVEPGKPKLDAGLVNEFK
jgi:hypothetical protein